MTKVSFGKNMISYIKFYPVRKIVILGVAKDCQAGVLLMENISRYSVKRFDSIAHALVVTLLNKSTEFQPSVPKGNFEIGHECFLHLTRWNFYWTTCFL